MFFSLFSDLIAKHLESMHDVVLSFYTITGRLFITYSVDTAKEMFPFAKFLTDQGFKPAVSSVSSLSICINAFSIILEKYNLCTYFLLFCFCF